MDLWFVPCVRVISRGLLKGCGWYGKIVTWNDSVCLTDYARYLSMR